MDRNATTRAALHRTWRTRTDGRSRQSDKSERCVEPGCSAAKGPARRDGNRHQLCRPVRLAKQAGRPVPRGTVRQPVRGTGRPRGMARTDRPQVPDIRLSRCPDDRRLQRRAAPLNQQCHQPDQFAKERKHPGTFTQPNIRKTTCDAGCPDLAGGPRSKDRSSPSHVRPGNLRDDFRKKRPTESGRIVSRDGNRATLRSVPSGHNRNVKEVWEVKRAARKS